MTTVTLPLITIAIATFNRAEILRRSLRSLYNLSTQGLFRYEVVVIDNASTDHTSQVVLECAGECQIEMRPIVEPIAGLPFARNRSVIEARGDWVAFFDDDQLADPDWLLRLYESSISNSVKCVGGSRSLLFDCPPKSTLSKYANYLLGEIDEDRECFYHPKFLPCTGNVIVAKEVFDKIGLFNEACVEGGEDGDFFLRLLESGYQAFYQPKAHVQHLISSNRLESKYLRWIAYRHGLHLARRDFDRKGMLVSLGLAGMRWGQAVTLTVPKLLYNVLLRRVADVVASQSKIALVCGYTQYVFNGHRQSPSMVAKSIHRGKG